MRRILVGVAVLGALAGGFGIILVIVAAVLGFSARI
jgi:hypothetical protein